MKVIFLLSGENIELGREEIIRIFNLKKASHISRLLVSEIDERDMGLCQRLSYTNSLYAYLFSAPISNLEKRMRDFNWQKYCKGTFCLRIEKKMGKNSENLSESKFAGFIWGSLKNPKVSLENPDSQISIFIVGKTAYCGMLLEKIHHDFEERKAHKRQDLHPSSLHPRLARCLVNLTGIRKGSVTDPFCGTGGILIEAGLIGLKVIGYDLYGCMVEKARNNLLQFGIKKFSLAAKDALKLKRNLSYVVTDVPYGLNTSIWVREKGRNVKISMKQEDKREKLRKLRIFYLSFLTNLKKLLKGKAVIVFPNYANAEGLIKKAGFRLEGKFSQYIHRSLTREIFLISK